MKIYFFVVDSDTNLRSDNLLIDEDNVCLVEIKKIEDLVPTIKYHINRDQHFLDRVIMSEKQHLEYFHILKEIKKLEDSISFHTIT